MVVAVFGTKESHILSKCEIYAKYIGICIYRLNRIQLHALAYMNKCSLASTAPFQPTYMAHMTRCHLMCKVRKSTLIRKVCIRRGFGNDSVGRRTQRSTYGECLRWCTQLPRAYIEMDPPTQTIRSSNRIINFMMSRCLLFGSLFVSMLGCLISILKRNTKCFLASA